MKKKTDLHLHQNPARLRLPDSQVLGSTSRSQDPISTLKTTGPVRLPFFHSSFPYFSIYIIIITTISSIRFLLCPERYYYDRASGRPPAASDPTPFDSQKKPQREAEKSRRSPWPTSALRRGRENPTSAFRRPVFRPVSRRVTAVPSETSLPRLSGSFSGVEASLSI